MKKFYILTVVLAAMLFSKQSNAQQDPQYTQYMYNMNVLNPAYAGSKESLSIGLLYRDQWSGIDGAPQTFTFAAHSPVGNGLGLGISGVQDQIGPVEETNVYADISYTIDLDAKHKLAFGIKAGATFQDIGFIDLAQQNDAAFEPNISESFANLGAGLFFYSDKYYLGLSVPNFLSETYLDKNGRGFGTQEQHYFVTAGYVFDINENIKFKPSTLVKTEFSSYVSFDVNANFLFYDRFEIGASYRYEDAVSGLMSVKATDWLQLGFAYDSSTNDLNEPSYEAFVIFDIFFKKKTFISPRYF
ncbi:PorP/SprF family type IX secretion system membrane protein [Psychroflexus halocasei]|uniref:Type IX secretion system membrane protein, PorP/SprF family n=1 Tax=Psychroflexus halocasei TaxID=908615 RepID=A0A1H3VPT5_9FLAO|nr:type IX secretion system membrane protein PorP/SprF [Psychroflexus halocasei]SDZ76780.1 type IX secretion system membrane protein, PorP/SprF family [Psychroflexus halocasei]